MNLINFLFCTALTIGLGWGQETDGDSQEIVYYDLDYYFNDEELEELCKQYPPDGFYPSPKGINFYLYCNEDIASSYEAKCPHDTPIFKDGSCEPLPTTLKPTTTPKTKKTKKPSKKTTRKPKKTTSTTAATTTSEADLTSEQSTRTTEAVERTSKAKPTISTAHSCPTTDNPHRLVLIASKTSCSQFYVCYHGDAILMSCASDLQFNSATSQCDYAEKVKCKETDDDISHLEAKCRTSNKIEYYNHPKKCHYFYYCRQGHISLQQCPFMHAWSLEKKLCIRDHLSDCVEDDQDE